MSRSKQWLWIGAGLAVVIAGAVAQEASKSAEANAASREPDTVLVHFFAPGNAMRAKVVWTGPQGSETYRGELPLMNTNDTQGVAYRVPSGSAVSMTVVNEGSTGATNLGFAGKVGCRIEVDGFNVSSDLATGYNAAANCSAVAE